MKVFRLEEFLLPAMPSEIPEPVVEDLIRLGASALGGQMDDELLERLRPFDAVNRLHWNNWNEVAGELDEMRHRNLAKGLVVAEERLRWSGGSVAGAIWVFRSFERRFPASSEALAEWLLENSDNPWISFGSSRGSARSMDELRSHEENRVQRRNATAVEERLVAALAESRRAVRNRRGEMRRKVHRAESATRSDLLAELKALPPQEALLQLAMDDDRDLLFYPPELLDGLCADLDEAGQWALERVKTKAAEIRKGPWRDWLNDLEQRASLPGPECSRPLKNRRRPID